MFRIYGVVVCWQIVDVKTWNIYRRSLNGTTFDITNHAEVIVFVYPQHLIAATEDIPAVIEMEVDCIRSHIDERHLVFDVQADIAWRLNGTVGVETGRNHIDTPVGGCDGGSIFIDIRLNAVDVVLQTLNVSLHGSRGDQRADGCCEAVHVEA